MLTLPLFTVGAELLSSDAMEIPMASGVGESTMQLLVVPSRQRQAGCHRLSWVCPASYAIHKIQFLLDLGRENLLDFFALKLARQYKKL